MRGSQTVTQVALMADLSRNFGAKTEALGHKGTPALHRFRSRRSVKGGITLYRIEAAVFGKKIAGLRRARIKEVTPPRFVPR